jgi:hypothetical protein
VNIAPSSRSGSIFAEDKSAHRPSWKNRPYDIAPDGRFLIIRSAQVEAGVRTATNMIVVQNWLEELKRLVPVN